MDKNYVNQQAKGGLVMTWPARPEAIQKQAKVKIVHLATELEWQAVKSADTVGP